MKRNIRTLYRFGGALLLTLSAALTARADYQTTVLSQGPAAYYPLNGTVQPSTAPFHPTNSGTLGASADGTYGAAPLVNIDGPFAGSVALGLEGTQYATTPWVAGLNTASFTFEVWANPSVVPKFAYLAASAHIGSPRAGWYIAQDDGTTFGLGSSYVVRFFYTNGANPSITLSTPVPPVGIWLHLALTYDGTTAKLYTNGVLAASGTPLTNAAGLGYVPNPDSAFTVGCRSDNGFPWPGKVAEAAMYGSALSATRVAAHYTAGTTAPGTYAAVVGADAPLLYDRYQAPPQPTVVNVGTLGSAGNGLILANAVAGGPGPNSPSFPGFAAGNKAAAFGADGGSVQLPKFNFNTNTVTISGWVNASNAQLNAAGIVMCSAGTTHAGLMIDRFGDSLSGGLGLGYIWNDDISSYNWSPTGDSGLPALPNSDWAYVALVVKPTQAEMYIATINPPTFTSVTNFINHNNQPFDGVTLIGTNTDTAVNSAAKGFVGSLDEVAIWNRSLTAGELYTQFGSAVTNLPPIIFADPPSPDQPIVAGDTLTLTVNAGGTPNLSYQWRSNSIPIPDATNSVYTKPNFSIAADSGSYTVVVTNLFGSVTSGPATVTGQLATSPVVLSQPVGRTLYTGGSLNLSVVATGGGLKYQWKTNGTAIGGATAASYAIASVTTNNAASYSVSVTNALGATNLGPYVINIPVVATNSYEGLIIAAAPEAWWRLNETPGSTKLMDAMGRHDGYYTNVNGTVPPVALGVPGIRPSDTAASFSASGGVGVIPFSQNLNPTKFTYEGWVKTSVLNDTGLVPFSSSSGNNGEFWRTYPAGLWSPINGGGSYAPIKDNGNTQSPIAANVWTHLVMCYDATRVGSDNVTHYPWTYYINGMTDGFIWTGATANDAGPFIIGGHAVDATTLANMFFNGQVDEVAVYPRLLSSAEITNHFVAGFPPTPPSFTTQPVSKNAFAGENVTFSTSVAGQQPITLQWKKNGLNLTSQTNNTLIVSNVFYGSADNYSVAATNSAGGIVSSNATISVYYPPTYANLTNGLVLHLKFDGDYADSSGHNNNGTPVGSPSLVPGKIGSQALNYSTVVGSEYNYVTLGTPSDLLLGTSQDFSVAYWMKLPTGYINGDLPILSSSATSYGGVGVTFAPSYQRGGWSYSLVDLNTNQAGLYGPDNSVNDGAWHHIVETFSRTGNGKTYLDGVLVSSISLNGLGNIDSGLTFNIGQGADGLYTESGTNTVDDIGIWRRALTDIEARSVYIAGQNYGKSFDTFAPAPVNLNLATMPGGQLGIAWEVGTLQQANNLLGPWTPVVGATPPFYQFIPGGTNTFFRVAP